MPPRSYRWLLVLLAAVGLVLDLGSKYVVFARLVPDAQETIDGGLYSEHVVVPGVFKLLAQFTPNVETGTGLGAWLRTRSGERLPHVNQGALFGLGRAYQQYANSVFAGVSILAAVVIGVWGLRPATGRDLGLCAALGLILAGTLGNLYDRLVFGGVRDFLYFHWIEWPVFNLADCWLVLGAGLLLLQAFWPPAAVPAPVEAESTAASA
jgi:lipoprotein signal peptidase